MDDQKLHCRRNHLQIVEIIKYIEETTGKPFAQVDPAEQNRLAVEWVREYGEAFRGKVGI